METAIYGQIQEVEKGNGDEGREHVQQGDVSRAGFYRSIRRRPEREDRSWICAT